MTTTCGVYNGVAKGAKLVVFDTHSGDNFYPPSDFAASSLLASVRSNTNSRIFSNSW
jgi:hypothetical protein